MISKEELEDGKTEKKWIVKDKNGAERAIQRYRDIEKKAKDGTRIVILACESQEKVHYGMVVRNMLYDSLDYMEQINEYRRRYKELKTWRNHDEFLSGLKKEDFLNPVITIVFYYGDKEEGWDAQTTLHGLTGMEREEYRLIKKYIPNYYINVISLKDLEQLSCPNQDLQMIFGMLKCRKDKKKLREYITEHAEYFTDMDEESYDAAVVMLGKEQELKGHRREKEEKKDMCKALDDLYNDGVMEGKTLGRAEGRAEGRVEAILDILREYGTVPEKTRCTVTEQKDEQILGKWLHFAIKVNSVKDFEKEIARL